MTSMILALLVVTRHSSRPLKSRDQTFHVSQFTIEGSKQRQTIDVRINSMRIAIIPFGRITCYPIVVRDNIVVPVFGTLTCINSKGRQLWKKDLQYFFNPSKLVSVGNVVVANEGPMTVGARSGYKSDRSYYQAVQKAFRTLGLDAATGQIVWNHDDEYSGVPIVATGVNNLICASMTSDVRHSLDGRALVLNELRTDGKRLRRWRAVMKSHQSLLKVFRGLTARRGVSSLLVQGKELEITFPDSKALTETVSLSMRVRDSDVVVRTGARQVMFFRAEQ